MTTTEQYLEKLPKLDCGMCGSRSCSEFAEVLSQKPEEIKKCVHLSGEAVKGEKQPIATCQACASAGRKTREPWKDSLGRDFDFVLDLFANEPGPRETILPHNPMVTRELDVQKGDILIGRPMGMSCGCPITHCGVAVNVDHKTGVIVWCVTGPLGPRSKPHKDLGYYAAHAYEGIVKESNKELKIGMRYWFMPHKCMLQWRHSGLVNFLNKSPNGLQVRVEGLFIG
jgi:uncharacterized Fe-S cluster-containing protein